MRWQRAIFSVELCIHRQHCAVNWIKVGKIIRHLRLPQFAVRQHGTRTVPLKNTIKNRSAKAIPAPHYSMGILTNAGNSSVRKS